MAIEIGVKLNNPGQFFGCCGLFELATQLFPGAEATFDESKFVIDRGDLTELLDAISQCQVTNTMTSQQNSDFERLTSLKSKSETDNAFLKGLARLRRESPIILGPPFDLVIDWFLDDYGGGSRFKTWAGQQSVLEITRSMKSPLVSDDWKNDNLFEYSSPECGVPFNFDSDLGGQGGPIDIGFSFDPLRASSITRIESAAKPALEFLSFVGMQRFRPSEIQRSGRFFYAAWEQSLPITVAAVAATGALAVSHLKCFEFRLLYRTKYLKSFLPSIQTTGVYDD